MIEIYLMYIPCIVLYSLVYFWAESILLARSGEALVLAQVYLDRCGNNLAKSNRDEVDHKEFDIDLARANNFNELSGLITQR